MQTLVIATVMLLLVIWLLDVLLKMLFVHVVAGTRLQLH